MNDVQATPVPTAAMAARELRRVRARRLAIAFAVWVATPTLLAAVYYAVLATPEYESVAVVTVDAAVPIEGGADKKAVKASVLAPELDAIREHLLSRPTMLELAREQGLLRHWQGAGVDWWSRLGRGARAETAHDYYLRKVSATIDAKGSTLTVGVRAFSAREAQEATQALVASAERFLDRLSARSRRALVKVADARIAAARERLSRARAAAGPTPAEASDAALDVELARDQMRGALEAAETAHVEATRRRHELVVVAEPSLPAEARYPRRAWSVATVFFAALVLMSVFRLLVAVVREHAQI